MHNNPLFPSSDESTGPQAPRIDPHIPKQINPAPNPAADLIRQKLARLYADEPDAEDEISEVRQAPEPQRSKHQQFMYNLSTSGKSLAQIQTEWHSYYLGLPDAEKHQVWQEFYEASARSRQFAQEQEADEESNPLPRPAPAPAVDIPAALREPEPSRAEPAAQSPFLQPSSAPTPHSGTIVSEHQPQPFMSAQAQDPRTPAEIKQQVLGTITRGKLQAKHHVQSILFGLGFGALVILIVLFSFFNEVIIAPFIQPSRTAGATPIIIGTNDIAPTKQPEVIIPKINLEIPLDFSVSSTDENQIENALEGGVVHYPTTVLPGQQGNTAFFGHSSNNIFNPGKYKFAFVLLHELVPGDTFYLTYNGKVYSYQVYDKQIVDPSQVSVLNNVAGKSATATLITCDPPGTSLHRLVVWGEQTSPSPDANSAAAPAPTTSGQEENLPGNGPTLWHRLVSWLTGQG